MTPLVSIIVPVYNNEQNLDRCIESILSQSFTDFELLLIDDGSIDKSGSICELFEARDSRVRVFHKPNGGVSSARNMGLKNVRGQYVVFVDSDDWVKEQYLEHLMCSDSDLVVAGFQLFGLWEDLIAPTEQKEVIIESLALNSSFLYGYVWAKRFRYSVICNHDISFREDLFYCEDICFVLNYLEYIDKLLDVPFFDYQHSRMDMGVGRDVRYKMSAQQMIDHIECFAACFDRMGMRGWNNTYRNYLNLMLLRKFIVFLLKCDNVREYLENALVFRNQKWAKDILQLLNGKREKRIGYGIYYCPVVSYYLERLAFFFKKTKKKTVC